MMATKDVKMATDNLICPVCKQLFKNPKYLPCHHPCCEQCLEKIQVQSKIRCPECRKEAIVPPGGVKDLDNSILINRLVDELLLKRKVEGEDEVRCNECHMKDPAVAFCPDCNLCLCHLCNGHHKRSIKSHGHGTVALTELRSKKNVTIRLKSKPLMCRKHDLELLFYCETCDELVCMCCAMKDHIGHNHDTVKNMVGKHKEELKKITAPVEEMIRGLSDTHDNIEKMKKKIRQQGDEVNEKINQCYSEVIQKLIEQKKQLKQQVHDTVSQKVKAVTTQLEEVEYAQVKVFSMKELNDAVEKSSDQEVFSVKKQVIDRMQQITDKYRKVNLPPVQQATMEFVPTKVHLGLLCSTAKPDPQKCMANLPKYCIKGKEMKFNIITKDYNGDHCSRGGSQVSVQLGGVNNSTQVSNNNDGSYMASFVPQQVGEVKLSVFFNGDQIKGSPYNVIVRDYTLVNKPSKIVNNDGNMTRPWGIAFGKNGMWAVTDNSKHYVYIFNGEDQLVKKFGSCGHGNSQFTHPQGVAFDNDNHLYVADCGNHRVQKFTIDGQYLLQFGSEGFDNGKLKYPNGLKVHNGNAYVSDRDNKRISVFQTDGVFLHTIGSGQLGRPYDVAVNGNNQLLVVDYDNHCIYTFTLDGDYVGKFGTKGTGTGQLNYPRVVAVDLYGFIVLADAGSHRVSIFDKDYNYINCFGSKGSAIGQFQYPYGIAVSPNGNIYVSDYYNNRIQIFFC